jgi:hypothetical protein
MRIIDWVSLAGIVAIFGWGLWMVRGEPRGRPRIKRAEHVHMVARNGRLVEFRVIRTEEEDHG